MVKKQHVKICKWTPDSTWTSGLAHCRCFMCWWYTALCVRRPKLCKPKKTRSGHYSRPVLPLLTSCLSLLFLWWRFSIKLRIISSVCVVIPAGRTLIITVFSTLWSEWCHLRDWSPVDYCVRGRAKQKKSGVKPALFQTRAELWIMQSCCAGVRK